MLTGTKAPRARRPAALAATALASITALMLTACTTSPAVHPTDPYTVSPNTASRGTGAGDPSPSATSRTGSPIPDQATSDLEGCEGVNVTVNGKQQPARGGPGGGRTVAAQALKIGGVPWNLGHYR